ncbi:Novobiocin biosynthesis protein H [Mycobacterium talmoniae]|uniref:Novobiocin biosynthesis protein H n=1 Tax=Mycobacterium talmoniae TaxID=1858794 RepID=A0A2S8BM51_9MYCO|nr:Novobiocin biosynthesis protein H [Mycobacterium talmoniae]
MIDGIPFPARLRALAADRGDDVAVVTLAPDGAARSLTFGDLDARANQWGRALAADGAGPGSLVALAIPNSMELVLAALGCWKVGAVPVPMRWDLPDWERTRVLAVIDPAVLVDDTRRAALAASRPSNPPPICPTWSPPPSTGSAAAAPPGCPR